MTAKSESVGFLWDLTDLRAIFGTSPRRFCADFSGAA